MSAMGMLLCVALAVQDAPIREVTVFGSGALVQRRATLAPDGTAVEFRGLPGDLDREALRARAGRGLAVSGLEVSERLERRVPEARVEELRETRIALQREIAAQQDDLQVCDLLERHFGRLYELPQPEPGSRPGTGAVANWLRYGSVVGDESVRNLTQRRELTRRLVELHN
ncbi:MAG: DUF4140 domain-containing protein, partial [Planctomycetota bacterium]|nr:DUF4140 domain-containing protein [Planctomycetota bacterium]